MDLNYFGIDFTQDPYKMVLFNIISSIILGISLFFYKFIYPKRNINLLLLLIIISILPVLSIFRPGTYESGDFNIHIFRNMSFYDALLEGEIRPTWSRDLNATYGYPTFLIEAPLVDYIPSFFKLIGFSFIDSLKLLFAISFVFSGLGLYKWAEIEFGKIPAFIASIIYLFAPFHLIDMHLRAHPGDMLIYMFTPWILLGIIKFYIQPSIAIFIFTALMTAGLILSHPTALVILSFLVIYIFFKGTNWKTDKKNILFNYLTIITGILLSSFYWMPIVFENKYILTSIIKNTISFEKMEVYLFSPYKFGLLFQGPNADFRFLIGYVQLFIFVSIILLLIIKKKAFINYINAIFYIIIFSILLIILNPVTKPVWEISPFFKNLEYSYRILIIMPLITASLAASLIQNVRSVKFIFIICFMAIFSTILNWGHRNVLPGTTDAVLRSLLPYSTSTIEGGPAATPRWTNPNKPWMSKIPEKRLEVVNGNARIQEILRTSNKREYIIDADTPIYIKENTYYYPGWKMSANNKQISIEYQNPKYPNIITAKIEKGLYFIRIEFFDTSLRKFANQVSLTMLIFLTALILILHKKTTLTR